MRLRWRRTPRQPGEWNPAESHQFHDGTTEYATVQELRGGGWFWYGMGENTARRPVASVEEAKRDAEAHVRKQLRAINAR